MGSHPINVLLIEDNPGDVRLIREFLRESKQVSFNIEQMNSLVEGIDRLKKGGIEIVLLDLHLPDSQGPETFNVLNMVFPNLAKVIITGLDDEETGIQLLKAGAQDYLIKGQIDSLSLTRTLRFAVERKLFETRLLDRKQFNNYVLENSPNPILVINTDSSILYVNTAMEKLTGYSISEIFGQKAPYPWWPAESIPQIQADNIFNKTLEINRIETYYLKKNKETFWVVSTTQEIRDYGNVKYYIITWLDITERKYFEQQTNDSRIKLQAFINQSLDGIIMADNQGKIIEWNKACELQTGISRKNALGKYLWEVQYELLPDGKNDEKYRLRLKEQIKALLRTRPASFHNKVIVQEIKRTDGERRVIQLGIFLIQTLDDLMLGAIVTDITELKQSEDKIKQSEEKYHSLVNNVKLGVFRSTPGPRGQFLEVNPAMEEITGYSRHELLTMDVSELYLDPGQREIFIKEISQTRGKISREFKFVRKDKAVTTVTATNSAVRDNKGQVLYMDGILEDISERKLSEEKVILFFKAVYGSIDGIILINSDRVIIYANPAFEALHGYGKGELVGKPVTALIQNKKIEEEIETGMERTGHWNGEVKSVKKNLETFPAFLSLSTVKDENNTPIAIMASIKDITEHKRNEEKLNQQYSLLSALINSPEEIDIFSLDTDYRFTAFNENYRRAMLNFWKTDIKVGHCILDYMSIPEWKASAKLNFDRVLKGKAFIEIQYQSENGIFLEVTLNPIRGTSNEVTGIAAFIQDITERREAEARTLEIESLKRINKVKSELLSNVSHELRTPLASIKGFIETLIETDVKWSKKERLEFLNAADVEVDRLNLLIQELLDMSRIDSERLSLNKTVCSVTEIFEAANSTLANLTVKHRLEINLLPDIPEIEVDKMRIVQVITNLTENAAKFSSENSSIKIKATDDMNNLIISVADQGIGLSPEEIGKLFNRFYQVERAVSGKTRGTGLGLSICKGIVEAHGGKIWVKSQVGQGSTFSLSIPLKKAAENS